MKEIINIAKKEKNDAFMIECAQFVTLFCVNKAGCAIYDAFFGNFSENKMKSK